MVSEPCSQNFWGQNGMNIVRYFNFNIQDSLKIAVSKNKLRCFESALLDSRCPSNKSQEEAMRPLVNGDRTAPKGT
ncbi:hypothetical protein CDL15_Pgr000346 [Punica granatum]|uniref:Uncharacterized protein n=1 Tax=Punica granatum TaxID=22663 RepID=A0A218XTH9_PUNGR|nr:hypothetical protein CDL15_Pgr000346 [Punica granatum]